MKTEDLYQRPWRHLFSSSFLVVLTLLFFSCDKKLEQELDKSDNPLSSARLNQESLFHISYEVETFTMSQLNTTDKVETDHPLIYKKIAAQPRLEKKSLDFRLHPDGSYQMTTIRLKPTKTDRLPRYPLKREEESGPYKTIANNGNITVYDENGKELGSQKVVASPFARLAQSILNSKPTDRSDIAAGMTGHPLINKENILFAAREKNAVITEQNGVTQIKFDLAGSESELGAQAGTLSSRYIIQSYDFAARRLLGTHVFDKAENRLISRSTLYYDPVENGNMVSKTINENFEIDPKTGTVVRHIREDYYSNMKIEISK